MKLPPSFLLIALTWLPCHAAQQESPSSVAIGQSASSDKNVEPPSFVVEAESVPARLKIDFRYHNLFSKLKGLTFTDIPSTWAKAGIRAGDHVTQIESTPIECMKLRQFFSFIDKLYAPIAVIKRSDPPAVTDRTRVPIELTVQREGSKEIKFVTVIMTARTGLIFWSNGF